MSRYAPRLRREQATSTGQGGWLRSYFASPRWKALRQRVLEGCRHQCLECRQARAVVIHFKSHSPEALTGDRLDLLIPCCRKCFRKLFGLANPPARPGFCCVCRSARTGGDAVCSSCLAGSWDV